MYFFFFRTSSNRIRGRFTVELQKINNHVGVIDDWLIKMDSWVSFVEEEAGHLDRSQARLIKWGDGTYDVMNLHEVALVRVRINLYSTVVGEYDCKFPMFSNGSIRP